MIARLEFSSKERKQQASHTLRTVDCLLTGLHEPEASHLDRLLTLGA